MALRLSTAPMPGIENALGCTCCHSKNELRTLKKSTKLREKELVRRWEDEYVDGAEVERRGCPKGGPDCDCRRAEEDATNRELFRQTFGWDRYAPAPANPEHRLGHGIRLEDLPPEVLRSVGWPVGADQLETLYWVLGLSSRPGLPEK